MKKTFTITLFTLFPAIASAASLVGLTNVKDVANTALEVVGFMMQTIFALISLGVIYTVYRYIKALRSGDAKAAVEYRKLLIGAIVGLAVVFSLWGIISLLSNTLGWGSFGRPVLSAPTV